MRRTSIFYLPALGILQASRSGCHAWPVGPPSEELETLLTRQVKSRIACKLLTAQVLSRYSYFVSFSPRRLPPLLLIRGRRIYPKLAPQQLKTLSLKLRDRHSAPPL